MENNNKTMTLKEKKKIARDKYKLKNPWASNYHHARQRGTNPKHPYYKRGIRFEMTMKDFKYLWIRDNASSMTSPSIDRIDGEKGYALDNCQFLELSENSRLGNLGKKWSKERKEGYAWFYEKSKRKNRECPFCHKEFYPEQTPKRFCSRSCANKNRYSNLTKQNILEEIKE